MATEKKGSSNPSASEVIDKQKAAAQKYLKGEIKPLELTKTIKKLLYFKK